MATLRPAHWTDHGRLKLLIDDFAALHHSLDSVFRPRWLGFTEAMLQTYLDTPGDIHVVAEQDGNLAGYVWAHRGLGNAASYAFMRRNVFVYVLAVAPAYRRQGIGRQLFAAIEAAAVEFDAEIVQLSVVPANDPARTFYEALGYLPTGEIRTKTIKPIQRLE